MDFIYLVKGTIKRNNKTLKIKRNSYHPHSPNRWTEASGHVEAGETFEEAIIRETKEETNLDVIPVRLIKSRSYKAKEPNSRCIVHHYELKEVNKQEVKLSEEHVEFKWE